MRAGAEGEVPVRRAADIETFGIGELRGVAVGGADAQRHRRARRHRDAAEFDRLDRHAVAELVGAFEPQHFLDRGLDQRRDSRSAAAFRWHDPDSATRPLPIRLVVVSWPALSRKMQLCSSSFSVSRSPLSSP